ncbi:MAG: NAD(P)H-dependent oxidoreductase subunit E [Candidatus Cloacimonetes bacterium]|nr:NAD(P)H-dependent oxidoreductase subunit E [Candidatus Cloacimonadota bacterium]
MTKKKVGSVLVVGAGIAGIQSSLDLANSGFKVYLLEQTPAIGGTMAQLDKTFPTNDCAMCIVSPKLVDCGRHPNIEIITNAELGKVVGEAGNFKVVVKKNPRYVDEDKCTGCAACTQNCPVSIALYPVEKIYIKLKNEDLKKVKPIMDKYRDQKGNLLPILQQINKEFRYLPEDILRYVSDELNVHLADIYNIVTFYNAFNLEPRGKHIVTVCIGTACHVQGAPGLIEALEDELDIKVGETTKDMNFTLETARCFGCCGLAPVITVNEDVHGKLKRADIPKIVKQYKSMEEKQDA